MKTTAMHWYAMGTAVLAFLADKTHNLSPSSENIVETLIAAMAVMHVGNLVHAAWLAKAQSAATTVEGFAAKAAALIAQFQGAQQQQQQQQTTGGAAPSAGK